MALWKPGPLIRIDSAFLTPYPDIAERTEFKIASSMAFVSKRVYRAVLLRGVVAWKWSPMAKKDLGAGFKLNTGPKPDLFEVRL